MRIAEFRGNLPKKAGVAKLEFSEEVNAPTREQDLIILPSLATSEFVPLMGGRQFLYRHGERNSWFGGTDEAPFLTHLDSDPWEKFLKGGEDAFYEALKPMEIKAFERGFGVAAKRQGDFFFIESPFSFEACEQFLAALRLETETTHIRKKNDSLFLRGTRHRIAKGRIMLCKAESSYVELVMGTVEAPDHEPLVLRTPHFVEQASGFFNQETAKKAD